MHLHNEFGRCGNPAACILSLGSVGNSFQTQPADMLRAAHSLHRVRHLQFGASGVALHVGPSSAASPGAASGVPGPT